MRTRNKAATTRSTADRERRSMKSEKLQHEFAAKTLLEAVNKCEKKGVSAEVLVQTFVSVAATLLPAHSDEEEVATLLEGCQDDTGMQREQACCAVECSAAPRLPPDVADFFFAIPVWGERGRSGRAIVRPLGCASYRVGFASTPPARSRK
jgi:hypothetical protein